MKRLVVVAALAFAALAQTRSRVAEYALVLQDERVAGHGGPTPRYLRREVCDRRAESPSPARPRRRPDERARGLERGRRRVAGGRGNQNRDHRLRFRPYAPRFARPDPHTAGRLSK